MTFTEPVHIELEHGEWWLHPDLANQLIETPPEQGTIFGVPVVDEVTQIGEAVESVIAAIRDKQCAHTKSTLMVRGLSPKGAVMPIISGRSRPCPCLRVHTNGKRKPYKSCCGKGE